FHVPIDPCEVQRDASVQTQKCVRNESVDLAKAPALNWAHATCGYPTNWTRIGHQMGRWKRELRHAREIAPLLSVRGLQRRNGHHGEPLQKSRSSVKSSSVSAASVHADRNLRDPADLGGRP